MRILLIVCLCFINAVDCSSQVDSLALPESDELFVDSLIPLDFGIYREVAIYRSYAFGNGRPYDNTSSHSIELGIWQSKYATRTPMNFNYYAGNEFLFNDSQLILGPKVGCFAGFGGGCFGTELIYYTDFNEDAIRCALNIGMCFHNAKLTVNPQINLTNENFRYTNLLNVSFSYQLKSLTKARIG